MRPRPHSPASNAFFQPCSGLGIAVGHDHLADRRAVQDRARAGRRRRSRSGAARALRTDRTRCGTATSATRTRLPSTVKLGPSGCVIEIGFRSVAHPRLILGEVARAVRRQRRDAVVDHLEHLVAAVVEVHDQPFDRARVAVVGLVGRAGTRCSARCGGRLRSRSRTRRPATGRSAPVDHVGGDARAARARRGTRGARWIVPIA